MCTQKCDIIRQAMSSMMDERNLRFDSVSDVTVPRIKHQLTIF
jgi:hypothetical protein